jgi:hypothetical protein
VSRACPWHQRAGAIVRLMTDLPFRFLALRAA